MSERKKEGMTQERKNKIGNWIAIVVLLVCILACIGFAFQSSILFWFFIILNFGFGPVCLIAYLIEVRRGIFAYEDDEEPFEVENA